MSITRAWPPNGKDGWLWKWIWWRRIGNYLVVMEWVQRRYWEEHDGNYTTEWRHPSVGIFHTEVGNPKW